MTDDETFVREFEAGRWPASQWHHREHIKLAYVYLCRYSFDQALARMRESIQAHNAAGQLLDSPTSGYHETMTQAWLRLVHFVICEYGRAVNADEFYENHPELSQKKTLRLFYSRERFMSAEAKAEFCEPDLTAFPTARTREPGKSSGAIAEPRAD